MSEHQNARKVRELFSAFRDGDIDAIRDTIAPDAVWHFPGRRGRLAGTHSGIDGIFEFLARVPELTNGTFSLELEHVVADDFYAVAFFRGSATRDGRRLDNPTCLKIRLSDGQAVEIHEFVWNLFDVDEFWA